MKSRIGGVLKTVFVATSVVFLTHSNVIPAEVRARNTAEKEQALIAVLRSGAAPHEKANACKELAIYGGNESVPALAALLSHTNLAAPARIALESIPGSAADEALRNVLGQLQGELLIGAINSVAARRDSGAVGVLGEMASAGESEIARAAVAALGNIGGTEAADFLLKQLTAPGGRLRSEIAESAIVCAERYLANQNYGVAMRLYDAVRSADVPAQRRLEALRGSILSRQSGGRTLLQDSLRSVDPAVFGMALQTASEMAGREVTGILGAELNRATAPERQTMLVLALVNRDDPSVLQPLLATAQSSSNSARIAILERLDGFDDLSVIPVLLNAASETDADVSRAARATLERLHGKDADAALLKRLPEESGRRRSLIIELAAARRIEGAAPLVLASATDSNLEVRRAALQALSVLGSSSEVPNLVALLARVQSEAGRDELEQAVTDICAREGQACLKSILPLANSEKGELRNIAVRILSSIGGAEALSAVISALKDSDETVRDEAVGTLATWPNNWPEDGAVAEPLLQLATSAAKNSHRVQGVRGYLQHLQQNKKLSHDQKFAGVQRLLPALEQAQEKRLAIATLSGIPTAGTLTLLQEWAEDPAIAEEACLGVVAVATAKGQAIPEESRKQALKKVVEISKTEATRQRAAEALMTLVPVARGC